MKDLFSLKRAQHVLSYHLYISSMTQTNCTDLLTSVASLCKVKIYIYIYNICSNSIFFVSTIKIRSDPDMILSKGLDQVRYRPYQRPYLRLIWTNVSCGFGSNCISSFFLYIFFSGPTTKPPPQAWLSFRDFFKASK